MSFEQLLNQYLSGLIAASEFVPEALSKLTRDNHEQLLSSLPPDAVAAAASLAENFNPALREIVIGGVRVPFREQIELARGWLQRQSTIDVSDLPPRLVDAIQSPVNTYRDRVSVPTNEAPLHWPIGWLKGHWELPETFFEPLPADILQLFEGGGAGEAAA